MITYCGNAVKLIELSKDGLNVKLMIRHTEQILVVPLVTLEGDGKEVENEMLVLIREQSEYRQWKKANG